MRLHVVGRARWVALFSFLLLIASAVPVLAAEGTGVADRPELSGKEVPTEQELAELPDSEDVGEAIGAYERELAEREQWLASPEAAEQREASRVAFAGLDAEESEALLLTAFAEQLEDLNGDPGRYLSTAQLVSDPAGPAATVRDEDGGSLLESSVPTRTENEQGQVRKVDLSLKAAPGGYETRNAVSDLRLPASSRGEVAVGEEGFEIGQQGASQKAARRLGDKNLFYPEVLPDTDLFVAPTSLGVELFNVLRSEQAPEVLGFEVEVPDGAVLRSDGRGGAEVVRKGETLQRIPKPWAIDAQQAEVPVALLVEGDSVSLRVPHKKADVAYPILVDPIVEDWVNTENSWRNGHNLDALSNGAWKFDDEGNSKIDKEICCWEGSKPGLMTIFDPGSYGPGRFGQWFYSTPNENVYIDYVWLIPFNRADNGCSSARPRDYVGLWNHGDDWIPIEIDRAKNHGNAAFSGFGKKLVLGMGTGTGSVSLGCKRILYSGGVGIWLNDDWGPGIDYAGVPSGEWFGDQKDVDIKVEARDLGLGVHRVKLLEEGKGIVAQDSVGNCTGLYGSRCPTHRTSKFQLSGDSFGQGIRDASVIVTDPTGKTSEKHFTTKVDNSKPQIALEGQLAKATGEKVGFAEEENKVSEGEDELSLPVYNLLIKAKDGSTESEIAKRSGVKSIKVFLDESKVPEESWVESECPQTSCELEVGFELVLSELEAAGKHELKVVATDFVGEERERVIEFEYFPATGMKDDYAMHYFPLPDGSEGEEGGAESGAPELAVNVLNGNLVYHQRDIDIEGPAVDLEVERYYNSQLPSEEGTEWGDGWTLAQTPDLEPEGGLDAKLVDQSGAVNDKLELPAEEGEETFDKERGATLEKKPYGAYELTEEGGEAPTSTVFDSGGTAQAELTEGPAKVDYVYEGEELAEIAVDDPGSAGNPTEPPEEPEEPEEEPQPGDTPVFSSAFGSQGSGPGALDEPGGMAVDAQGELWIVDRNNNRIQHFDRNGAFVSQFGEGGSAEGQLYDPTSIMIDDAGDIWVVEMNASRIQKFDQEGNFLGKFGASWMYSSPVDIAIDGEGIAWVADLYGGYVMKLGPGGAFLNVVGYQGSGEGEVVAPIAVDVGPEGNVWIADAARNEILIFDPEGNFVEAFGAQGSGDGEFEAIGQIDIDDEGNVWAIDLGNGRVQRLDLEGNYVGQFGAPGSGQGQFDFNVPSDIAVSEGRLWVSDTINHRIQKWALPEASEYSIAYSDTFGSNGTEDGQLRTPAGLALGAGGDVWVADHENNRIQRFTEAGEFVSAIGSGGSEPGEFAYPSDIDLDESGEIWVADKENHRVQRLDAGGEFLSQFGEVGFGAEKLFWPTGVSVGADGSIWVSDLTKVQRFSGAGEFIERVGSAEAGPQFVSMPTAIDVDVDGNAWIATENDEIFVFDEEGGFIRKFGSTGTGPGQFKHPAAIAADAQGSVWIADRPTDRVQHFDLEGNYLGEFGESGEGLEQIDLGSGPTGIVANGKGRLWLSDSGNDRIQEWIGYEHAPEAQQPEEEPVQDDPKVEIETPEGMVATVEGEEAGTHTYEHEGEQLVSHEGEDGKTDYEYTEDEEELLSKVTLPNGTWAEIEYYEDNRVKSVTVKPAGDSEVATNFQYKDSSPRKTIAEPDNSPNVNYDIGDDGSILKWWNESAPPEIDLHGNLYDNREEDGALWSGDFLLEAEIHDPDGISAIEIIAGGDALVAEFHCEQDPGDEDVECPYETKPWVTNTGAHPAGHLQIEVIATDSKGKSASESFWVDIPEPPPPPAPGTPVPPSYNEIKEFREEFGLEKTFPVADETELIERIFDLIKAWHEPHTQAGQTARASWKRWGVPLRRVDIEELNYRLELYAINGEKMDRWYENVEPSDYAGYYLDHASGGKMYIGFTDNQETRLEEVRESLGLAGTERLQVYPTAPTDSYQSVQEVSESVLNAISTHPGLGDLVVDVALDESGKVVRVKSSDVEKAEELLVQLVGPNAPIVIEHADEGGSSLLSGRYRDHGRMRAGDFIFSRHYKPNTAGILQWRGTEDCTAGFGAKDGTKKVNGRTIWRLFVLTAGHCTQTYANARVVYRATKNSPLDDSIWEEVGSVNRDAFATGKAVRTDAEAIRVTGSGIIPRVIYGFQGGKIPTGRAGRARVGDILCFSGVKTQQPKCGPVVARSLRWRGADGIRRGGYWVKFSETARGGDSGGPVWSQSKGVPSIGIISARRPEANPTETLVEPLLHPRYMPSTAVPGILRHPLMRPLSLKRGR